MLWLSLLLACPDYGLGTNVKNPGADSLDDPRDDTAVGMLPFPCEEEGTIVLEWPIDENCTITIQSGTLDTVVEWNISAFEDYPETSQVLTAPMVGHMTDDDGDGVWGSPGDIPDIVMVGDDGQPPINHGGIHIVSGDGVEELRAIYDGTYKDYQVYPYRYATVALGDIDNDGVPEIVVLTEVVAGGPDDSGGGGSDSDPPQPDDSGGGSSGDSDYVEVEVSLPRASSDEPPCRLSVFNVDGTVKWVAEEAALFCAGHVPAIADLEGDGPVEVVLGPIIFEGATGALRAWGTEGEGRYAAYSEVGFISVPIDLDDDELQEIVTGNTIYDYQGQVYCQVQGIQDGFPAVADFDGNDEGDVVSVGNGTMTVFDKDCTVWGSWDLDGIGNGGPPTIADFDADFVPEIGVATDTSYSVYEFDGTLKWSQPVLDASSHTTGSSVFDFDGDGQAEVVYGDETTLWIFDGATGAVRLADKGHSSRTLHEYPTIADVDGDGMAEIVVPQGGGHHDSAFTGIYVLGSANNDWQYARPVWNQHAYSITNINDNLSIPSPPADNWPDHNNFRSGDINPVSGGSTPDVIPSAVSCDESCKDGMIGLMVRLGNGGTVDMRDSIPISVYSEINGQQYLLATLRTGRSVPPGRSSEAVGFTLNPLDVPDGILVIQADDNGTGGELNECHEDNNVLRLDGIKCE